FWFATGSDCHLLGGVEVCGTQERRAFGFGKTPGVFARRLGNRRSNRAHESGLTFGDSVAARMQPPFNDPVIWNFAIPYAAAALLVAMLVDTQLAFLTGMITALFAGMLAPGGMQKSLFAMISCSAAIY